MKFTEFFDSCSQLPTPVNKHTCYTDLYSLLEYFVSLDVYAVKVENLPHNSIHSARDSLYRTAKRFNLPIRMRLINSELYLINTLKEDEPNANK